MLVSYFCFVIVLATPSLGGGRKVVENVSMAMVTSYNGRYDVNAHHVFNDDDLAVNTTFECLLSLPGTEYQISSAITYQPGKSPLI